MSYETPNDQLLAAMKQQGLLPPAKASSIKTSMVMQPRPAPLKVNPRALLGSGFGVPLAATTERVPRLTLQAWHQGCFVATVSAPHKLVAGNKIHADGLRFVVASVGQTSKEGTSMLRLRPQNKS